VLINALLQNPQSIVISATGSGKTIVSAALSYSVEKYGRSIVIVPNQSLILQTEADYINLGLDVGVYYGGKKELGKTHTICTWQSLHSLLKKSKAGEAEITIADFLEGVVCVIVDEAHGIKATALQSMLTAEMATVPIRWAMTGTLPKEELSAKALQVSIGDVVGTVDAKSLQDAGVLAQCHINIMQLRDHSEFADYQSELRFLTTNTERLQYIATKIISIVQSGNTLILVDRIEAGTIIKSMLDIMYESVPDAPEVVFLSGDTKTKVRKVEYESVTADSNKIIIATYGIASIGINIVNLYNIVLLEPGKSFVRTIQSIGRGLRKGEDKSHVEIWDITSSCKYSKRHLTKRKQFYNDARYEHTITKLDYKK